MINKRLSHISSDEDCFNQSAAIYQQALNNSGFTHQLTYSSTSQSQTTTPQRSRTRKRNIVWFDPPYSRNVSTNIGKIFLKIIDSAFPSQHPPHKIFNRNTVKVSYCCTNNLEQIISSTNKGKLAEKTDNSNMRKCNCRNPDACPLDGNCLAKSLVYQAQSRAISDCVEQLLKHDTIITSQHLYNMESRQS